MFESKKKIEMWASCGDDFFYGLDGEKKDFEMAVDFYGKAAKKKHPRAAFMLGLCYELGGKGVKKNIETAEEWYRLAVGYGSDEALARLESGDVVVPPPPEDDDDEEDEDEDNAPDDETEEDEGEAEDDGETEDASETESAEEDDAGEEEEEPPEENHYYVDNLDLWALSAEELLQAGQVYLSGANIEGAIDFFEYAAILYNNDDAAFCAFTAYMSDQSKMREGSLPLKKAFWWLTVAAKDGHAQAKQTRAQMERLAHAHAMSIDDTKTLANGYDENGDYTRARYWFVMTGRQEDSYGAYWAGRYYYYGRGIRRNYARALEWLENALDYGEYAKKSAEYYIGKIYLAGGYGVDVDLKKALAWLKKAELDSYVCDAISDVYEKLGDIDKAEKYNDKAIKLAKKEEKKNR